MKSTPRLVPTHVLDSASDAVFIANPQGRFIYANRQAAELLGYTVEELLRLGIADVPLPEAADHPQAIRDRLNADGRVRTELRLRRKDGAVLPVEVNATVLPDGNLFGSWRERDASELVKSRQALRQSEQRYQAAFQTCLDAITINRLSDGTYIDVNQAMVDVLGFKRDEVIGRTSLELNIWADPADRQHLVGALQRDSACRNQEFRFRKKSGELMWGLMSATVMELDDVPCMLAVTRDITDIKAAQYEIERHRFKLEQLVQERTVELQEANRKLFDTQFAMESVGIAIHWVNADTGRFLYVNKFAAEMLGYSVDEMLNLVVPDIDPNVDAARFKQYADSIREQHRVQFESTNRTKDGHLIPVDVVVHHFPQEADTPSRYIAFLRNITRRKEAELALVQAKEAADAANAAKSAFLANMSHEIRTPLHVIMGLGHLLRRDIDDPVQQERVDQLCASSDHLLAIINDVLDLSKIEAHRLALDRSDFRLYTVVTKVERMVAGQAQDKGLTLTMDISPQLLGMTLNGDTLRLTQVLINLCDNAAKFTDKGVVRLGIHCLAETADTVAVRFTVADTGIGIAPAHQARLFEAFQQADTSTTRERGGTGLGLAISQRLVALMGGTIRVQSGLGVGSTFGFDLTLARATTLPEAETAPAVRIAADFYGRHILFAEDHPLSQEILAEMLDGLGCVVDVASDGAEAVACAQEQSYDLILMDMLMPRMDGLAATRAIRALPQHRDTPIIALTANAYVEDRQRCLDAGMNGHLGKPVTPATLAAALAEWLPNLADTSDEMPDCDCEMSRALGKIAGLVVGRVWRSSPTQLAQYVAQLNRFMEIHAQDMARLREHIAARENEAAQVLAHSLQGIAGLLGARRIASLASEIVQGLRAEVDDSIIKFLADACEAELAILAGAIQALPLLPVEPSAE
jgi:two-component system sensor histidine kinase/response regulator